MPKNCPCCTHPLDLAGFCPLCNWPDEPPAPSCAELGRELRIFRPTLAQLLDEAA